MHAGEPGVRIDEVGNRGQRGQIRKGNPRGSIATGYPLMRSLPVVVGGKSFCHLADFIQGFGTRLPKALLMERALISFDKPILLRVMRIADKHGDPERLTKAHQGSRKVAALWGSDPTRVAVQGNRSRLAV